MSVHEILAKRIGVTVLPKGDDAKRRLVQERPASWAYFSIGDLIHILNTIQHNPFRELHYFTFKHGRYHVTVYDEEVSTEDFVPTEQAVSRRTKRN